MKVMCVTGHRPKDLPIEYGYDYLSNAWRKAIDKFKKTLIDEKITVAITGMALGADIAFAIAVLELKSTGYQIELHCYIPCKDQSRFWNDKSKSYYDRILERADKIIYISKDYTKDCMIKRNIAMVKNSDVVLAFYDGRDYGGTYSTIIYAVEFNKKGIVINPKDIIKKEIKL